MSTVEHATRLSLKHILVPTDFSAASEAAVPFAAAVARIYGSTLLVAHAIAPVPHLEVVTARVPAEQDYTWPEASEKMTRFVSHAALASAPWTELMEQGDLRDVIPAMIRDHAVDLVVLGTHGRRGVSKLVLGSEAEKIYRLAACPVLTVGPHVRVEAATGWTVRRVLCAVEPEHDREHGRAQDAEHVLQCALALAADTHADLTVLQAIPLVPWQYQQSVADQARQAIKTLLRGAHEGCEVECAIRWEHPVDAILRTAQDRHADLIVMGVRKSRASSLATHLPWPIASEVVSGAQCPVLTVRV